MKTKVKDFIKREKLLHGGATVLIGVSGGPDSLALLHILASMEEEWNLRLIALTVDHGLRGDESKQDVEYVRRICSLWNIEIVETFLDVPAYKRQEGTGTQLSARNLRYQFFAEQMEKFGAAYLALGHHADDQAESVLMGLTRGATISALQGIPCKRPFAGGMIIRPFMSSSREEIEDYCKKHGIVPRRDPSNEEDNYTRNYFRLHVLPLLKAKNPNFLHTIRRLSDAARSDETYLTEQAEKLVLAHVEFTDDNKRAAFQIESFAKFPIALQRRAFHLILNYLYDSTSPDLSYAHEDRFFSLISSSRANASVDLPLGLKIIKEYHSITFSFAAEFGGSYYIVLQGPGSVELPDGSILSASVVCEPLEDSRFAITYDLAGINWPLSIRSRKPGDKMRVKGMKGTKKIKDIFIDEKIPIGLREGWPIVEDGKGNILWLAGLRKAVFHSGGHDGKFLRLHYDKNSNI
ncbi:tRNA lysidine(34) synthetase TilS [Sediminibacillus dalangtanensis]|uniref:tRNA(Ile)-lysidine synthase n=1 Tax=Sediminibacillus dalangtanensis TaxID=2729421 RepID=A0ABX7VWD4_9BACI|nr:tRNA lysidine(34) synthetase TilS [Sediminibacillus dalangtanensis]QTN01283.1 tRNA lysidine(34) synthetase TilS [Sediminibacillus dalangtanensis]